MASYNLCRNIFLLFALFYVSVTASALPLDFGALDKRQTTDLVGYFAVFFKGDTTADQRVWFYLSNGNDPCSFRPLNGDQPVLIPKGGTGATRDMSIVVGRGNKWYILGTDLDLAKADLNQATRHGSLSMFIWESSDLITWGSERLIKVEEDLAGMLWAPESLFDASKGKFFVYWSAKIYSKDDPQHRANGIRSVIRATYTSDFHKFDQPPFVYLDANPNSVIDMSILSLGGSTYVRFIKREGDNTVYSEVSTSGIYGPWTGKGDIEKSVEGPAPYLDNQIKGKGHLLLDRNSYMAYESNDIPSGRWTSSCPGFPKGLRHGYVLPVNKGQYDGLSQRYR
ncbi:arabinosidase [Phyllosticta citribraziliensis]|uniref:Arabinosidase n=1 Tax=Phyllosticta citribraziliensis TaxID=989973 RepID=A0ABR1M190_9PEZI